jgi:hypothetical protein
MATQAGIIDQRDDDTREQNERGLNTREQEKRSRSRRREHVFYIGMAVAMVLAVFAGFSRTFYLRPRFHPEPLIPLLLLHGIVFTSWLALFVIQTTLVAAKRVRIHQRLGIAGMVLAVSMIVIGTITAIVRAKVINVPPSAPPPLTFLTIPTRRYVDVWNPGGFGFLFSSSDGHTQAADATGDHWDSARGDGSPAFRFHSAEWAAGFFWFGRSLHCAVPDL